MATKTRAATAVLACTAALLGAGCGGDPEPAAPTAPLADEGDPGQIHVHGLGVDPADGALFIATHTGLFRAGASERTATRVGDHRQDTMGFTVVGPGRFLGSGHPDPREDLPPYLGLVRSDDAGRSWRPVSLLGRADFHVLEAAGRRVVGYGSDLRTRRALLLVSGDGGRTWAGRADPPALVSLAIAPHAPDVWLASSAQRVLRTGDAGRTWRRSDAAPGLLGWPRAGEAFRVDARGRVSASTDGGRSWAPRGDAGGAPAAFEATADELLVALHDGVVVRSRDGGRTWTVRSRP